MTKKTWKDWNRTHPNLASLFGIELGPQDFDLFGDNLEENIANHTFENHTEVSENTLSELESLLPLLRSGKIDPDQMLEELETYKLPEYKNIPSLQYFEDICAFLKENIEQKTKEEGAAEA